MGNPSIIFIRLSKNLCLKAKSKASEITPKVYYISRLKLDIVVTATGYNMKICENVTAILRNFIVISLSSLSGKEIAKIRIKKEFCGQTSAYKCNLLFGASGLYFSHVLPTSVCLVLFTLSKMYSTDKNNRDSN